jgi:hypothetical protein
MENVREPRLQSALSEMKFLRPLLEGGQLDPRAFGHGATLSPLWHTGEPAGPGLCGIMRSLKCTIEFGGGRQ